MQTTLLLTAVAVRVSVWPVLIPWTQIPQAKWAEGRWLLYPQWIAVNQETGIFCGGLWAGLRAKVVLVYWTVTNLSSSLGRDTDLLRLFATQASLWYSRAKGPEAEESQGELPPKDAIHLLPPCVSKVTQELDQWQVLVVRAGLQQWRWQLWGGCTMGLRQNCPGSLGQRRKCWRREMHQDWEPSSLNPKTCYVWREEDT